MKYATTERQEQIENDCDLYKLEKANLRVESLLYVCTSSQ